MRRTILAALFLPAVAAGAVPGAAHDLDAAAIDPRLAGYPELTITLRDEGIDAPASVPAGPTLLVTENAEAGVGHAFVLRVPDDVSDADLAAALTGGPPAEETPEWFWRSGFVGNGDRATTGLPAIALVDLDPGRYVAGDPYRPASEFALFEATDEGVGDTSAPGFAADARAELFEMGFRLPETVEAGPQVWEVANTGAMLHEIAILPVPAGATPEDVEAAVSAELEAEYGGDAAAARAAIDGLGPEWDGWSSRLVAGVGVLSPQRSSWAQFDLPPGTYGVVCYVPEPTTMTSHVMFGMTEVFTVEAPSA